MGQNWPRWWLVEWRHQLLIWTNVDFPKLKCFWHSARSNFTASGQLEWGCRLPVMKVQTGKMVYNTWKLYIDCKRETSSNKGWSARTTHSVFSVWTKPDVIKRKRTIKLLFCTVSLKIILSKLLPHRPGDSELGIVGKWIIIIMMRILFIRYEIICKLYSPAIRIHINVCFTNKSMNSTLH